jgi:hypothetical protein
MRARSPHPYTLPAFQARFKRIFGATSDGRTQQFASTKEDGQMKTIRVAAFLAVCAVAATVAGAAVSAPADQAAATAGAGSIV